MSGRAFHQGRIGPNAATRLAQALGEQGSPDGAERVFALAGLTKWLTEPPRTMVDEAAVARLHRALVEVAGPSAARRIAWRAGLLTGDYLLANRIPRFAQVVLALLPRAWRARILTRAIARHAWTFTGSGRFLPKIHEGLDLEIRDAPLLGQATSSDAASAYYAATFERIFRTLVDREVTVAEIAGANSASRLFRVTW